MAPRRALASFALALAMIALSIPVSATTTSGAPATTVAGEGSATTAVGETTTSGAPIVPAVSTEVTVAIEPQPDWTYRFFIPTLLVVAALVVIFTVIRYFTNVVRKRYRVVR